MLRPALTLAALGAAGYVAWKLIWMLLLPLVGTLVGLVMWLLKAAVIGLLLVLAYWVFKRVATPREAG